VTNPKHRLTDIQPFKVNGEIEMTTNKSDRPIPPWVARGETEPSPAELQQLWEIKTAARRPRATPRYRPRSTCDWGRPKWPPKCAAGTTESSSQSRKRPFLLAGVAGPGPGAHGDGSLLIT
jgi:hypothetical protein